MQPQVVKEIRQPEAKQGEVGKVVHSMEPKVLNRIDMPESQIKRVQEGFRQVFNESGGTAAKYFTGASYKLLVKQVQLKLCMAEIKRLVKQTVSVKKHIT